MSLDEVSHREQGPWYIGDHQTVRHLMDDYVNLRLLHGTDASGITPYATHTYEQWWDKLMIYKEKIGLTDVPFGVFERAIIYSDEESFEFGNQARLLNEQLEGEEHRHVFGVLDTLMAQDILVENIFPKEFEDRTRRAFAENVTNLLYTFNALRRGERLPKYLPLRGGGSVRIDSYTFEEAVRSAQELREALGSIGTLLGLAEYESSGVLVNRVNKSGEYATYRLIDGQRLGESDANLLFTLRARAGTSYDPTVEYANREGTQASIGFTVDRAKPLTTDVKKYQVDPFCIRIDNEGDSLALDIGSIFGKQGSLGKKIADLIALGDYLRNKETGQGIHLNHNAKPFAGSGLEEADTFADIVLGVIVGLELRSGQDAIKIAALGRIAASSLRLSADSL